MHIALSHNYAYDLAKTFARDIHHAAVCRRLRCYVPDVNGQDLSEIRDAIRSLTGEDRVTFLADLQYFLGEIRQANS